MPLFPADIWTFQDNKLGLYKKVDHGFYGQFCSIKFFKPWKTKKLS